MAEGIAELKALLQAAKIDEARALVDRLIETDGADDEVIAAYEGIYLAEGVRRATQARDRRRAEIRKLPPGELDYHDPAEVSAAFDASVACFDRVLQRSPRNGKAMLLRAGVLHMKDRNRNRTLGLLKEILTVNPDARDAQMNLRKVMRPCAVCGDTGFCMTCHGSGLRRGWLGGESRCGECAGQGVCRRCTIL